MIDPNEPDDQEHLDDEDAADAAIFSGAIVPVPPDPAVWGELATTEGVPRLDRNPAAVYLARLSRGGRRAMQQALRTLLRIIGSTATIDTFPWQQMRYQHTAAIRSALAGKYAPATCNQALSGLRGVLKECFRLGLMSAEDHARAVDIEPVRGFRLPTGRGLTSGEITALFRSCGGGTKGLRDYALLAVMYGAGPRRAEVCSLNVEDWDGTALVITGKGNKQRRVPLPAGAAVALDAWLAVAPRQPKAALFLPIGKGDRVNLDGRLTGEAVLKILRLIAGRAEVKTFTPHDLRRSFISDLLDAGADLATVQKLAGHADPSTTERYDRRDDAVKKRAVDLLHIPTRSDGR